MKKILSMLLALIMCLGAFFSCANEDELREQIRSEVESELRPQIESEVRAEIAAQEQAITEKRYQFYQLECPVEDYRFEAADCWTVYTPFRKMFDRYYNEAPEVLGNITEETFEEYAVLVVHAGKGMLYNRDDAYYCNLRAETERDGGTYSIDYNMDYLPKRKSSEYAGETEHYNKSGVHLVLIPKDELAEGLQAPFFVVHKNINVLS